MGALKMWRLRRGGSRGFLILDWRALPEVTVTPDLDGWLAEPARQAQALEWFGAIGGRRSGSGAVTAAEWQRSVKPRLRQAFTHGELLAIPRHAMTGGPVKAGSEGVEDLIVFTRGAVERAAALLDLESWLGDEMMRPLLLNMYKTIGGSIERGQWTMRDLRGSVKSRLEDALRRRELIVLPLELLPVRSPRGAGGPSEGRGSAGTAAAGAACACPRQEQPGACAGRAGEGAAATCGNGSGRSAAARPENLDRDRFMRCRGQPGPAREL